MYIDGYVDLDGDKRTHVIRYSRTDALQEQAILPIEFHLHDSAAEWQEYGSDGCPGRKTSIQRFDQTPQKDKALALYTALQTEFAEQLMDYLKSIGPSHEFFLGETNVVLYIQRQPVPGGWV